MMTTLHLPVNKELKEQAEAVVKEQGYSSLQEVLRVLISSLAKGEIKTTLVHVNRQQTLTPAQERYLTKREEETRKAIKQEKAHSANSVEDMMGILEDTSHKHE